MESLPDDVLCHILSFLPTRDAVATSLLSKRWKPLWLSFRSFDLDDNYFSDFHRFSNFVTSSPQSIQSLRLTCGSHFTFEFEDVEEDAFDLFLYRLSFKGIQELDLCLVTLIELPFGFYTCNNLVTLKLDNVTFKDGSSYINFPLLKSLNLNDVVFGNRANMFDFFCGCPNVEDVEVTSLSIVNSRIPQPPEEGVEALPKLVRAKISELHSMLPLLCNAQFLYAGVSYWCCNPTFHNLIHMDITLELISCDVMWNWFAQVLQNCPNLQNLTVQKKYACVKKHGNDVHWKDPQIIPQCLSSRLKTFKFKSFNDFDCEVQFAKYIMQNSKVLQNMTIHTTLDIDLKHPMLETLSLCPMGSATCNLHFDLESAQHLRRPTAL
ncbi:cyclin-like F-box protein [Medicago truncatula]|uniref:Cyclin-like F-box protein n=1 Tax=Medicago truncatula TaxID=3880 RepID=G7K994_MEDTR|nr:cyclin-like F-box protein [Medicago truncatula]